MVINLTTKKGKGMEKIKIFDFETESKS